jgi:hypothetical protein
MSLSCDIDVYGGYVEIGDELVTSAAPCRCLECRDEIPAFTPFYMVRNYRFADDEDWINGLPEDEEEIDLSNRPCCEGCSDLAASVLELGYCWEYGSLRIDIREMADQYN